MFQNTFDTTIDLLASVKPWRLEPTPVTSLKEARVKRDTAKKQIAGGIDPYASS